MPKIEIMFRLAIVRLVAAVLTLQLRCDAALGQISFCSLASLLAHPGAVWEGKPDLLRQRGVVHRENGVRDYEHNRC